MGGVGASLGVAAKQYIDDGKLNYAEITSEGVKSLATGAVSNLVIGKWANSLDEGIQYRFFDRSRYPKYDPANELPSSRFPFTTNYVDPYEREIWNLEKAKALYGKLQEIPIDKELEKIKNGGELDFDKLSKRINEEIEGLISWVLSIDPNDIIGNKANCINLLFHNLLKFSTSIKDLPVMDLRNLSQKVTY